MSVLEKKEIEKLKKIKGEVRGMALKGDGEYILKEKGKEGVERIERELKEAGFPLEFKKMKAMHFYPLSTDAAAVTLMNKIFEWKKEEMIELGSFLSKSSLVLRVFMKHFTSIEKVVEKASEMWRKNYTVGDLEVEKFNKKEGKLVVNIKNFKATPLYCPIFQGYLESVTQMVLSRQAKCEETKCIFKKDPYCEFTIDWTP